MWTLGVPPLELVIRAALIYVVFFGALRLFGKREIGQFTLFDLALVLIAANALQPAITGPALRLARDARRSLRWRSSRTRSGRASVVSSPALYVVLIAAVLIAVPCDVAILGMALIATDTGCNRGHPGQRRLLVG